MQKQPNADLVGRRNSMTQRFSVTRTLTTLQSFPVRVFVSSWMCEGGPGTAGVVRCVRVHVLRQWALRRRLERSARSPVLDLFWRLFHDACARVGSFCEFSLCAGTVPGS